MAGFTKACEELKRHQKLLEQQQQETDEEDENDNDTTANDMDEDVDEKEEEQEIREPKAKRFKEDQEVISSSNVVPDKPVRHFRTCS